MREEGKVRAAGCLRLELVGDAAAAVMDVAEAELAAAGAALADLAFVAVQVGRARLGTVLHSVASGYGLSGDFYCAIGRLLSCAHFANTWAKTPRRLCRLEADK